MGDTGDGRIASEDLVQQPPGLGGTKAHIVERLASAPPAPASAAARHTLGPCHQIRALHLRPDLPHLYSPSLLGPQPRRPGAAPTCTWAAT
ncbi:hypothetical protein E2562_015893 [Oryza meyeriana var. granulata]|uniref:Uncharacterized protein n=1 Tax=Oryza meyeriana var. granulata TaxID=110450 RepID=A0A6G1D5H8_9ORYZ|nr:hypothetical protein E2562_015893 [Oryza meyeriana var. granulata]